MPESRLAQFAAGINDTFFSGLAQRRDEDRQAKEKEKAYRIQALKLLIEHPETKVESIPDLQTQLATEMGINKEPLVRRVIEDVRRGISSRQIPSGDKQETTASRVNRLRAGMSAESSELMAVPPEPDISYQPTRPYGDLTLAEAEQWRKMQGFEAEQKILTDRMQQTQEAMGRRQVEVEGVKAAAKANQIQAEYKLKRDLIDPKMRADADRDRQGAKQALLSGLGHEPSAEEIRWAETRSGELMIQRLDAIIDQKRATAEASRATAQNRLAQITHWKNMDSLAIRGEVLGGIPKGMAPVVSAELREVFSELDDVNADLSQLERLKAANSAPGAPDTTFDARIAERKRQREELHLKIAETRDRYRTTTLTVPQEPGAGPGTSGQPKRTGRVPPRVSNQQLQKVLNLP